MRILIYKRTHKHDPDEDGIFGNQDCMGRIRNWNYDAVIGIGGKSAWPSDKDIKYKVNWVGIKPKKIPAIGGRADCIVFEHFELYEQEGLSIPDNFPSLFDYMYGSKKRFGMSSRLPDDVIVEVQQILDLVKNSPPSRKYDCKEILDISREETIHSANCNYCVDGKDVEICVDINERC